MFQPGTLYIVVTLLPDRDQQGPDFLLQPHQLFPQLLRIAFQILDGLVVLIIARQQSEIQPFDIGKGGKVGGGILPIQWDTDAFYVFDGLAEGQGLFSFRPIPFAL